MNPTTLATLKTSFINTILGITPRLTKYQGHPWSYTNNVEDLEKNPRIRLFTLRWAPTFETPEWSGLGSEITKDLLRVIVSYGNIREEDLSEIVKDDGLQLRDVLYSKRDPTISGLFNVDFDIEDVEVEDKDALNNTVTVEFGFEISYLKALASV